MTIKHGDRRFAFQDVLPHPPPLKPCIRVHEKFFSIKKGRAGGYCHTDVSFFSVCTTSVVDRSCFLKCFNTLSLIVGLSTETLTYILAGSMLEILPLELLVTNDLCKLNHYN